MTGIELTDSLVVSRDCYRKTRTSVRLLRKIRDHISDFADEADSDEWARLALRLSKLTTRANILSDAVEDTSCDGLYDIAGVPKTWFKSAHEMSDCIGTLLPDDREMLFKLRQLKGDATSRELANVVEVDRRATLRSLKRLRGKGLVVRIKVGQHGKASVWAAVDVAA